MNFWDRVDGEREAKGIDQGVLASTIGETTSNVSRWKKKGFIPPGDQLVKIALLLDTSAEYLVTGRPPFFRLSAHEGTVARLSMIRQVDRAIESLTDKELEGLVKIAQVLADKVQVVKPTVPVGSILSNT